VIFSSKESKGSKAVEGETLLISKESKFEEDPSTFETSNLINTLLRPVFDFFDSFE